MSTKQIRLPCKCIIEMDVSNFKSGDRGVSCPRHERAFVISAVLPTEPDHRVTKEIQYQQPQENQS